MAKFVNRTGQIWQSQNFIFLILESKFIYGCQQYKYICLFCNEKNAIGKISHIPEYALDSPIWKMILQ
jgi:hypothetical protein